MIILSLGSTLKEMVSGPTVRRDRKKRTSKISDVSPLFLRSTHVCSFREQLWQRRVKNTPADVALWWISLLPAGHLSLLHTKWLSTRRTRGLPGTPSPGAASKSHWLLHSCFSLGLAACYSLVVLRWDPRLNVFAERKSTEIYSRWTDTSAFATHLEHFSEPLSEEIQGQRCASGYSAGQGRNSLKPGWIQML